MNSLDLNLNPFILGPANYQSKDGSVWSISKIFLDRLEVEASKIKNSEGVELKNMKPKRFRISKVYSLLK